MIIYKVIQDTVEFGAWGDDYYHSHTKSFQHKEDAEKYLAEQIKFFENIIQEWKGLKLFIDEETNEVFAYQYKEFKTYRPYLEEDIVH